MRLPANSVAHGCLDHYANNEAKARWRCAQAMSGIGVRTLYNIDDTQALARHQGGECLSDRYVNYSTKLIGDGILEFEKRFGTAPTELVMCPHASDIWRQAAAAGISLCDGPEIRVNPFASRAGPRFSATGPVSANHTLP